MTLYRSTGQTPPNPEDVCFVAIAENMHDSCLTFARNDTVLLHFELERWTRQRRATFQSPSQVLDLIGWFTHELQLTQPIQPVFVRHRVERVTPQLMKLMAESDKYRPAMSFEHLASHAGLSLLSSFEDAMICVVDGGGDRTIGYTSPNAFLFRKRGLSVRRVEPLFSLDDDAAVDGRAWAVISHSLFHDLHAAGTAMGLSAYASSADRYIPLVKDLLPEFLNWSYGDEELQRLSGKLPNTTFDDQACLAHALQTVFTESILYRLSRLEPRELPLVLAGGCALNIPTNTAIFHADLFPDVFVPSCPGDEGISLGAVLLAMAEYGFAPYVPGYPFLGLGSAVGECPTAWYEEAAKILQGGGIVATAIGRSEIGPRALGNRSLLAAPSQENRTRVSETLKAREWFRPVAPAILASDAPHLLPGAPRSDCMQFSADATALREIAPGVVHVDGTARHQTVDHMVHPHLAAILEEFKQLGEPAVLINTSLNGRGMPIAGSADDALRWLFGKEIDALLTNTGIHRLWGH